MLVAEYIMLRSIDRSPILYLSDIIWQSVMRYYNIILKLLGLSVHINKIRGSMWKVLIFIYSHWINTHISTVFSMSKVTNTLLLVNINTVVLKTWRKAMQLSIFINTRCCFSGEGKPSNKQRLPTQVKWSNRFRRALTYCTLINFSLQLAPT